MPFARRVRRRRRRRPRFASVIGRLEVFEESAATQPLHPATQPLHPAVYSRGAFPFARAVRSMRAGFSLWGGDRPPAKRPPFSRVYHGASHASTSVCAGAMQCFSAYAAFFCLLFRYHRVTQDGRRDLEAERHQRLPVTVTSCVAALVSAPFLREACRWYPPSVWRSLAR